MVRISKSYKVISQQVFIKHNTFHKEFTPINFSYWNQQQEPPTSSLIIFSLIVNQKQTQEPPIHSNTHSNNQPALNTWTNLTICQHHTTICTMKPHQTPITIVNQRMKAQKESQPLIQSVIMKHQHPVPTSKSQSYNKVYKHARLMPVVHGEKL